MKWYEKLWDGVKVWGHKWLGGLVMENKDGKQVVSLGRTLLLGTIGLMTGFWWQSFAPVVIDPGAIAAGLQGVENPQDVALAVVEAMHGAPKNLPPGLLEVFLTLCGYVFGTKVASALKDKWSS